MTDQCQNNINIHYRDPQVHVGFKSGTESRYCQDTRKVYSTFKKKNLKAYSNFDLLPPAQKKTANFMSEIKFSLHFTAYLGAV